MGNTSGVIEEINVITEIKPNVLDAKGIMIATFSSFAEPQELTEFFKQKNRNFLIFDLNKQSSGFNIEKNDIQSGLFGFLEMMNEEEIKTMETNILRELASSTAETKTKVTKKVKTEDKIKLTDIDKMTTDEKEKLFNTLIEKGSKNLSDYDKKILNKLATK